MNSLKILIGLIDRPKRSFAAILERPQTWFLAALIILGALTIHTLVNAPIEVAQTNAVAEQLAAFDDTVVSTDTTSTSTMMSMQGGGMPSGGGGMPSGGGGGGPSSSGGQSSGGATSGGSTGTQGGAPTGDQAGGPGGEGGGGMPGGQGGGMPGGQGGGMQGGGMNFGGGTSDSLTQMLGNFMGTTSDGSTTSTVGGYVFTALLVGVAMAAAGWLVRGTLAHWVTRLFRGVSRWKATSAVCVWAMLPYGLRDLFLGIYTAVTGTIIESQGLSFLVSTRMQLTTWGSLLARFLTEIDPFTIWSFVLLGIGLGVGTKLGHKSWIVAALVWVLIFVLKVFPTALYNSLSSQITSIL